MTKKIFLILAAMSMNMGSCIASENAPRQFSLDELIENADVSSEPPVVRELPWYINAIEKPASRVLFIMCDMWDWLRAKSIRVLRMVLFLKVREQNQREAGNIKNEEKAHESFGEVPGVILHECA